MAFNLVHSFRKHQKVWMAGILLVCMVTFVLCTGLGGGDFGSWITGLFGYNRGGAAARINGKNVHDGELVKLRARRRMADAFMFQALMAGRANARENILKKLETKEANELRNQTDSLIRLAMRDPRAFLQAYRAAAGALLNNPKTSGDYISYMQLLQEEADAGRPTKGFKYFDGNDTDEGLFEFILWRDEAGRLKIDLVDDGVRAEVKDAAHGVLTTEQWQAIESFLRKQEKYDFTSDDLLAALRDEFRVRLAQTWHLGYRPSANAKPAAASTPEQLWQFYQKNRSEFDAEALPIPVEPFVAQVEQRIKSGKLKAPTQEELKALFNKYKNKEKDPESAQPGFKIPKRVEIQWVTADPDSPRYKALASFVVAATERWFPSGWKVRLLKEHEFARTNNSLPKWTEPNFALSFYFNKANEKNWNRPDAAAAFVAQTLASSTAAKALGAGITPTWAMEVPLSYDAWALANPTAKPAPNVSNWTKQQHQEVAEETRKRASVAATMLLSVINPMPMVPGVQPTILPFRAVFAYASNQDQYLPLKAIRNALVRSIEEDEAKRIASADFRDLGKQISELKPAEKPPSIRTKKVFELVEQAREKYGFIKRGTDRALSKKQFEEDPDVKALREANDSQSPFLAQLQPGRKLPSLAEQLFTDATAIYIPMIAPRNMSFTRAGVQVFDPTAVYVPDSFPAQSKQFYYWKTAIHEAHDPSFAEARDDVLKEWKFAEARKLAQARADAIAKKLKAAKDDEARSRAIKDLAAELRQEKIWQPEDNPIIIRDIARLQRKMSMDPHAIFEPGGYQPYQVPAKDFKSPDVDEWSKKLVDMDGSGENVPVLANKPQTVFYVAARVSAPKADRDRFVDSLSFRDDLWVKAQADLARAHRADVVNQLKKQAGFEDLRSEKAKAQDRQERNR
jgi:hypothetical protein